jgi:hypothetical protein
MGIQTSVNIPRGDFCLFDIRRLNTERRTIIVEGIDSPKAVPGVLIQNKNLPR